MTDRDQFLRAIAERPDDQQLRLVFADWLDEHAANETDTLHAELIRIEVALEKTPELVQVERPTLHVSNLSLVHASHYADVGRLFRASGIDQALAGYVRVGQIYRIVCGSAAFNAIIDRITWNGLGLVQLADDAPNPIHQRLTARMGEIVSRAPFTYIWGDLVVHEEFAHARILTGRRFIDNLPADLPYFFPFLRHLFVVPRQGELISDEERDAIQNLFGRRPDGRPRVDVTIRYDMVPWTSPFNVPAPIMLSQRWPIQSPPQS